MQLAEYQTISKVIQDWYLQNKRELPWRDTSNPYKIWISEIILQQTRVNQGINYYINFINEFPTIDALAHASEEEVLKQWQGLGYYSRARNLHKASRQIMDRHKGIFPSGHDDIIKLAGIGDYTAAAISSFAFNTPHAVVDGNVYRVLSRIFDIATPIDSLHGKREFAHIANKLMDIYNPGTHNQAIMEFGALQCIPKNPDCLLCPLKEQCLAYKQDKVFLLPYKARKTKVSHRFFNYLFITDSTYTYLSKRVQKDIWQNLYEFPLIESTYPMTHDEVLNHNITKQLIANMSATLIKTSAEKHILSHQIINAQFFSIKVEHLNTDIDVYQKIELSKLDQYPISRLIELFLENGH